MNMEMKMNQQIMGKDVDMKNDMGFSYLFEVANDSANWKTISATISKVSMDMNAMGRTMHFDTDMPATDSGPAAIMGKVFGAMKGRKRKEREGGGKRRKGGKKEERQKRKRK